MSSPKYIAIIGPTGSGKSALGLELAKAIGGEIVSCDSVQVYKDFNIGSAKPTKEEQELIPHHLIDIVDWSSDFDASVYAQKAKEVFSDILSRKKIPILVGGTGLYYRSLIGDRFHQMPHDSKIKEILSLEDTTTLYEQLQEKDPKRASELHINDRYRIIRALEIITISGMEVSKVISAAFKEDFTPPTCSIRMDLERSKLHQNIELRSKKMLEEGLVKEVKNLLNQGISSTSKPMQTIGYKQVVDFLNHHIKEEELLNRIIFATRQYAKRQVTWFKKEKVDLSFDGFSNTKKVLDFVKNTLQSQIFS